MLIHTLFDLMDAVVVAVRPNLTNEERADIVRRLAAARERLAAVGGGHLSPHGLTSGDTLRLRDDIIATEAALS